MVDARIEVIGVSSSIVEKYGRRITQGSSPLLRSLKKWPQSMSWQTCLFLVEYAQVMLSELSERALIKMEQCGAPRHVLENAEKKTMGVIYALLLHRASRERKAEHARSSRVSRKVAAEPLSSEQSNQSYGLVLKSEPRAFYRTLIFYLSSPSIGSSSRPS